MPCPEYSARMSLAVDGQLNEQQWAELQQHLATCVGCRREWTALAALRTLASHSVAPAPGMAARVAQRMAARETRTRRLYSTLRLCLGSLGVWFVAGMTLGAAFLWLWGGTLQGIASSIDLRQTYLLIREALDVGHTLLSMVRPQSFLVLMPMTAAGTVVALALLLWWVRIVSLRWSQATIRAD